MDCDTSLLLSKIMEENISLRHALNCKDEEIKKLKKLLTSKTTTDNTIIPEKTDAEEYNEEYFEERTSLVSQDISEAIYESPLIEQLTDENTSYINSSVFDFDSVNELNNDRQLESLYNYYLSYSDYPPQ